MSTISELKVTLLGVMNDYQACHQQLADALGNEIDYPIWIQNHTEFPRESLIKLVTTWFYTDDETDAGQTVQMNGVVGVSYDTFHLVERCNELRQLLQETMQDIDKIGKDGVAGDDVLSNSEHKYPSLAMELLAESGFSRLNRRQATRHWIAVEGSLRSAGFFWNRYRKTVKLTRDQVIQKFDKMTQYTTKDMNVLENDRDKLAQVSDMQFVQVFPESIHQRVNLVASVKGKDKKMQRYAHTPVFYLAEPNARLPKIAPLMDEPLEKGYRLPVSTVTIEDMPYFTSFAGHRLLPSYR